jgi:hypothetical protein
LIDEVEDEFCSLAREDPPPALQFTGRMYPPQKDRMYRMEGAFWWQTPGGIEFIVKSMAQLPSKT